MIHIPEAEIYDLDSTVSVRQEAKPVKTLGHLHGVYASFTILRLAVIHLDKGIYIVIKLFVS